MVQAHSNQLLAQISGQLTGVGIKVTDSGSATTQAAGIVSQVIGVLTIFAVIWFALQIIFAGYAFLTSEGDEKKMEIARKRLTDGVLGLTIVIVALGLGSLIATLAGISNPLNFTLMFSQMGL
jgi:hypothetical protein